MMSKLILSYLLAAAAVMFSTEAAIADVGNSGMVPLLQQLSDMHGQYRVRGRMSDGTPCDLSVVALGNSFKVELTDKQSGRRPLVEVELTHRQRLTAFELQEEPVITTALHIRDRVKYVNAPVREVDLQLYMEEYNQGSNVVVIFEDAIKRRRYTCRGEKYDVIPSLAKRISGTVGDFKLDCTEALKFYSPWDPKSKN